MQALTEILAAVANGEGASDEVLTTVSLGALRALVRQEPVGFSWVEAESGKTDGLIYSGEPTRIGVQRAHQSEPREVPQYVYAAPVVAEHAVPDCYTLVPVDITIPMRNAFYNAMHDAIASGKANQLSAAYKAMLAAAKKQGGAE